MYINYIKVPSDINTGAPKSGSEISILMNIKLAIYGFIKHKLLRDARYSVLPQSKCVFQAKPSLRVR